MGQQWNIHWNDLKEIDLVDETLKLVAVRVVTLLAGNDLDEMEREILERYHKRQWFTSWQLNIRKSAQSIAIREIGRSHPLDSSFPQLGLHQVSLLEA